MNLGHVLILAGIFLVGIALGACVGFFNDGQDESAATPGSGAITGTQGSSDTSSDTTVISPITITTSTIAATQGSGSGSTQVSSGSDAGGSYSYSSGVTSGSSGSTSTAVVSATPTPTPDPIVGTWKGSKSVLFVYSGDATVTFRSDNTGSASGSVQGPGINQPFSASFTWQNLGSNTYRGSYSGKSLDFSMSGNTLTMTVNPAKLGLTDKVNMDITVDLNRV